MKAPSELFNAGVEWGIQWARENTYPEDEYSFAIENQIDRTYLSVDQFYDYFIAGSDLGEELVVATRVACHLRPSLEYRDDNLLGRVIEFWERLLGMQRHSPGFDMFVESPEFLRGIFNGVARWIYRAEGSILKPEPASLNGQS